MTRTPLFLAALASAAVPGLDPTSAEAVAVGPDDDYEIAYVQDSQDRRWVVTAPRTPVAAALLEDVTRLLALLSRRLDVALPVVQGHATVPEGRAAVHLRLPGRPLDFGGLGEGGLATEVGRTLAHIHNLEHLLLEEAGRPTYDAQTHRARMLSELDRAAATGHVPTSLLARWEQQMEDVSLWRFAPTAVHGSFCGTNVLASFDDDDASSGHVRSVLGWEQSRVGDPADDFADLVAVAPSDGLEAVLEAYTQSRIERPDPHLLRRARLVAELAPVRRLMRAVAGGDQMRIERASRRLRALDRRIHDDEERQAAEQAQARAREETAREQARLERERLEQERLEAELREGERLEAERQAAATAATTAPEPDWDATQPHQPFPRDGLTEAMPTMSRPAGAAAATAAEEQPDPTPVAPAPVGPAQARADDQLEGNPGGEPAPPPSHEDGPAVAAEAPVVPEEGPTADYFEIDEVEPLAEGEAGVLDLHEGASDFVPVERRRPPTSH